jgi:hypothetical protein
VELLNKWLYIYNIESYLTTLMDMQNLLVRFFRGESLGIEEVRAILKEYVRLAEKDAGDVIDRMLALDLNNPFARQQINNALHNSASFLSSHYTITRVFDKEGHILMVY